MYGLPDRSSAALTAKRDAFAAELVRDTRWFRRLGRPAIPIGIALVVLGVQLPAMMLGSLGGTLAGLGAVATFVGSHWLARRNADSAFAPSIAEAKQRGL